MNYTRKSFILIRISDSIRLVQIASPEIYEAINGETVRTHFKRAIEIFCVGVFFFVALWFYQLLNDSFELFKLNNIIAIKF